MNPFSTPFGAIFQAEALLNAKRVAPYVMLALFSGNALLWWGWGPAVHYGWATNSDFYIAKNYPVFSFMTLPIFTALIMGDPVIRDYRTGIAPLIFSKPVGRATYLLGKFLGNFFVLVCCQMAFALTIFLLQGFQTSRMIVQPARFIPYFKHFFLLVVITHLVLAVFYFTVGTLTRNAKIVYGLAAAFYPLYIGYQVVLLKGLPGRWRIALDPLLMNWMDSKTKGQSAEWLNQLIINYEWDVLANRGGMMLIAAAGLGFLCLRFSKVERLGKGREDGGLTTIKLAERVESFDTGAADFSLAPAPQLEKIAHEKRLSLPAVKKITEGAGAKLSQLAAAFIIELRLLCAERSLIVFVPLATLLCVAGLIYFEAAPDGSYSAVYAGRTAETLLLFLCAIALFYTGEAMHRDRELKIEPVLWSMPVPNFVLLFSKFAAMLLLSAFLCLTVCLAAIALQLYKGHSPVDVSTYLAIYMVILMPGIVFLISIVMMLNVLLREKYLAYAVGLACGIGLFYLYTQGYDHWLYNPLLYGIWTPSDLIGAAANPGRIILYRFYCLALSAFFLALSLLFFERRSGSAAKK